MCEQKACECGSTEVVSQSDIGGGVRYWCRPCAMQVVGQAAYDAMHGKEWDSWTTSAIAEAFEAVGIRLAESDACDEECACECHDTGAINCAPCTQEPKPFPEMRRIVADPNARGAPGAQ